jgi:hypothetical protein
MNSKSEIIVNSNSVFGNIVSWFFGIIFLLVGLVNTFWGNDAYYGVFIILLALIFFPLVTDLIKKITGISIPLIVKIILALFIIWTALGVGELFDKIELMKMDILS